MEIDSADVPPIGGEAQAGPSKASSTSSTTVPAGPSRPESSLLSYFGAKPKQAAQPSSYNAGFSSSAVPAPAKAKKTKTSAPGQALLGTTAGESSSWALGKSLPGVESKEGSKGKGKKKNTQLDGAEEAERKEMAKRVKLEKKSLGKGLKGGNGATKASNTGQETESDVDVVFKPDSATGIESHTGASTEAGPSQSRSSPTKRKRANPSARPSLPIPLTKKPHPPSQSFNDRSTVPLISSPPTINLSSSTESDDSESLQVLPSSKAGSSSSLTTHPLFSRSNSAISKGASQDDAIDIEDSPMRTKVVIEISDSPIQARLPLAPKTIQSAGNGKVVHSFFGKKAAVVSPLPADLPNSDIQVKPIQKTTSKEGKMNAFFDPGPKGIPGKLVDGWGGNKKIGEEWLVPFPGRGYPSHTGATSTAGTSIMTSQKRRKVSPAPCGSLGSFFSRPYMVADSPISKPQSLPHPSHNIPIPDHPALQSVKSRSLQSARETWCECYRPLTASQVLGNETESTYLRDWLQLLSVGQDGSAGPSNPKITRRVHRRKGQQLLDGWIVDDIGLYSDDIASEPEDEDGDGELEYEPILEAPSSLDPRPDSYPDFKGRLANTMLLCGPTGCGKSAAVYAVAEELGWEVFEVYPGVGKRNASNLMALVGDVGRNHVITGKGKGKITPEKAKPAPPPSKPKPSAQSFFGTVAVKAVNGNAAAKPVNGAGLVRKRANQLPSSSQGSQDDPLRLGDSDDELEGIGGEEADVLEDRKHGFRETLILLDEADLLYDEEGTFWPAVISLIAESRRPVILTCNDPQLIPIPSLPLQAILQFQPPLREAALPYLQSIATHESLPHLDPISLYDSSFSSPPDLLSQPSPLCPNGHEPIPHFDLRKAITQMQLDRGNPSSCTTGVREALALPYLAAGIEQRSFADAWIAPRQWAIIEANEIDRYGETADDLLGVDALAKPEVHPDIPVLAAYSAEKEMVECLVHLAPLPEGMMSSDLGQEQITHMRSLLPLLDPLIPLSSNLLPHFSLFTEYIPTLRSIVLADDLIEIAEEEALARGGERLHRKTGRPMRSVTGWLKGKEENLGYARYLKGVDKEGEDVVRRRQLGV